MLWTFGSQTAAVRIDSRWSMRRRRLVALYGIVLPSRIWLTVGSTPRACWRAVVSRISPEGRPTGVRLFASTPSMTSCRVARAGELPPARLQSCIHWRRVSFGCTVLGAPHPRAPVPQRGRVRNWFQGVYALADEGEYMRPTRLAPFLGVMFLSLGCGQSTIAPEDGPADMSLTLVRQGTGSGNVESTPGGIDCGPTCTADYAEGTGVVLAAVAASGSVFDGWTGGGCSGDGACVVSLTGDATLVATFTSMSLLTVTTAGSGAGAVTSAPAGIDCGTDCEEAFPEGIEVTLSAEPEAHSIFAGWSGGGCSGTDTCHTTMGEATTVTATFDVATFEVAIDVSGNGSGSVTSAPAGIACEVSCSESFEYGTQLTLEALPATGSTFTGWSGGGCAGTAGCLIDVTADVSVAATFTLLQHPLTVIITGGGGIVTSSPAGLDCNAPPTKGASALECVVSFDHGTAVTLTASPHADRHTFTGWSGGGCSGTDPTCDITLTAATTVTASFYTDPSWDIKPSLPTSPSRTGSPSPR